ncbi:CHAT domain-containing protein [Streptomyces malaysiensis]|uniref:CHAT domain-containing protein n=1 Tax=Streptomyces malaysiensis TaxID=92644 RepID=UPI0011CECBBE|nr:CHAT domain-containing protein [Streptomyces malaysiensis]
MAFRQVRQRLLDYERSGDPSRILGDDAVADAELLAEGIRPDPVGEFIPEERQFFDQACRAIGWLHYHRFNVSPGDAALVDLAKAAFFLSSVAEDPDLVPERMRTLIGPTAVVETRAGLAGSFLTRASETGDLALLNATIDILMLFIADTAHDRVERATMLSDLGIAFQVRHSLTGQFDDVMRAIDVGEPAVAAIPPDHPERARCLSDLSLAYGAWCRRSGLAEHGDRAIELGEASVAAASADDVDRPRFVSNLGHAYTARFERTKTVADVDRAAELLEQALVATPADHPQRAALFANLSSDYRARHAHTGSPEDRERAIAAAEQAVAAAPANHPERTRYLAVLDAARREAYVGGSAYVGDSAPKTTDRNERGPDTSAAFALLADAMRTSDPTPLNTAIETITALAETTTDTHPERQAILGNLGAAHAERYRRSGTATDLDRAMELLDHVVSATPADDSSRTARLSNLAQCYLERHVLRRDAQDLDHLIAISAQVVAATGPEDPARATHLTTLGDGYLMRYERGKVATDLEQAITTLTNAVTITAADDPGLPGRVANLGSAHRARFERSGTFADLHRAFDLVSQALTVMSPHDPARPTTLAHLGRICFLRGRHNGAVADLDQAIHQYDLAVAATPPQDPSTSRWLYDLATAHFLRYEIAGDSDDLDRCIEVGRRAVTITPGNAPERPSRLSITGIAHRKRYEHSGATADLDHAIDALSEAVATADGLSGRPLFQSNLGLAYLDRYRRRQTDADLDHAVDVLESALADTAADDPERPLLLTNLGFAHLGRCIAHRRTADLDRCIHLLGQAVATTPPHHPIRRGALSNLGSAYQMRFERSGETYDLDRAVETINEAIATTPEGHPGLARTLHNLGRCHRLRFDIDQRALDPRTLRQLSDQVARTTAAPPTDRIWAGRTIGSLAHVMGDHHIAVELLDRAVAMLPLVVPREAGQTDGEHRLGEHIGLVWDAIAAHCALGDPRGALEVAELGRGILLANHLDARSELSDLQSARPELAARLRDVRDQLDAPDGQAAESVDRVEERRRLWAEHDNLLAEIREDPRFTRFLCPPRFADLRAAAAGGAVVMVNVGSVRADAIVVTADSDPVLVPLPDLTLDDALLHGSEVIGAAYDTTRLAGPLRRQRVFAETASWLWDTIVEPVLAAHDTGDRLWWLPVGLLGLFPLHAAGHLGHPGALDKVVSSYTPTLRALAHARTREPATTRHQLSVAIARAPGLPDLPGTVAEAMDLHTQHPHTPLLTNDDATTARVAAALPAATWAHFACHATVDQATPSNTGLRLHDGTLTIADINRLRPTNAELAYLSACSTANHDIKHAEESIHLATAFHLAGYRHVVASLWPLADEFAATAAHRFYQRLPDAPNADAAAVTLHRVTKELRARFPDRPDLWASMIHSGP